MDNDDVQQTLPGLFRTEPREARRRVPKSGRELRDEAIERAIKHAGAPWKSKALEILWITARRYEYFFADDYHRLAGQMKLERPPDGRAWGGVVVQARKNGWISKTGEYRESKRPHVHAHPCPVYRSHIFREDGAGWEAPK
jgi:hypothetical protein